MQFLQDLHWHFSSPLHCCHNIPHNMLVLHYENLPLLQYHYKYIQPYFLQSLFLFFVVFVSTNFIVQYLLLVCSCKIRVSISCYHSVVSTVSHAIRRSCIMRVFYYCTATAFTSAFAAFKVCSCL